MNNSIEKIKSYLAAGDDKRVFSEIISHFIIIIKNLTNKYVNDEMRISVIYDKLDNISDKKNTIQNHDYDKNILILYEICCLLIKSNDKDDGQKIGRLLEFYTGILKPSENNFSIDFLLGALHIRKLTLGETHIDTIHTYYNMAKICIYMKKYDVALRYFNICLENDNYLNKKDNKADIYNRISHIYKKKGNIKKESEFNKKYIDCVLRKK